MKHNREYEIAWQGLKAGLHTYQYDINDRFMQAKDAPADLKNWDVTVTLKFDKKTGFFMLHFDVDGSVTTPCDRCGDDFSIRLWDEFDLVIKLTGDDAKEPDEDDVVFIPRSETVIDISRWIYEFIMLSVPLQRIHPDKANGEPGCNPMALQLLNKLSEPEDTTKKVIWKGLEELKEKSKKKTKK
jgi:uncharacterized metal-binding protein YceD (DUF177 family)